MRMTRQNQLSIVGLGGRVETLFRNPVAVGIFAGFDKPRTVYYSCNLLAFEKFIDTAYNNDQDSKLCAKSHWNMHFKNRITQYVGVTANYAV